MATDVQLGAVIEILTWNCIFADRTRRKTELKCNKNINRGNYDDLEFIVGGPVKFLSIGTPDEIAKAETLLG